MTDNNYYIYIPLPDVMVGLNSRVYNVSEDVGVVEVCAVMLMNNSSRTNDVIPLLRVSLSMNGTGMLYTYLAIKFSISITYPATSDEDYCAVSSILIFDSSQSSCVFVSIVDDDVVEETESFTISMERTPGLDKNIHFEPVSGDIKIIDNDGMFVWT